MNTLKIIYAELANIKYEFHKRLIVGYVFSII